jgi:hypothetical protein
MKRATREKLKAYWTAERRELARERALKRVRAEEQGEEERAYPVREPSEVARKLVVSRVPINPRMVECAGGDGEGAVMVEVGRNGTFVIGDEIECMKVGSGSEYRFVRMSDVGLRVDFRGLPVDRRRWEVRR